MNVPGFAPYRMMIIYLLDNHITYSNRHKVFPIKLNGFKYMYRMVYNRMDIYEYEATFVQETECQDKNYYLSAVMKDTDGELIMDYRVDRNIFFTFDYEDVVDYAKTSNPNCYISNNLEIVQVVFKDGL